MVSSFGRVVSVWIVLAAGWFGTIPDVNAQAFDYRFSVIATSFQNGLGKWGINDHGQVSYVDWRHSFLVDGRLVHQIPVSDGDERVLVPIPGFESPGETAINNTGRIAVRVSTQSPQPLQHGVLVAGADGSSQVLGLGTDGIRQQFAINDAGQVAWISVGPGQEPDRLWIDGVTIYEAAPNINGLDMNGEGTIVFVVPTSSQSLFVYDGQSVSTITPSQAARFDSASINDSGTIAFVGNIGAPGQLGVYTTDGVTFTEILPPGTLRSDGQIFRPISVDINNRGEVAWMDEQGGVFVGEDLENGRVAVVGDSLLGGSIAAFDRPVKINDRGQVLFGGLAAGTNFIVRADPPGTTPEHPVMPDPEIPGEGWTFPAPGDVGSACPALNPLCQPFGIGPGTTVRYFDPEVAVGYIYEVTGGAPNFTEVLLPADIGDGLYELYLHDGETFSTRVPVVGGQIFSFVEDLGLADGVDRFLVLGIEACAQVDPDSPVAFVTGLSFARESTEGGMHMKPIRAQLPECCDGIDNDGDGLIDFPDDPVCASESSSRESSQCQNGMDDDGDGKIDFDGGASWNGGVPLTEPDSECVGRPWRNKEAAGSTCGIGAELAFVAALLVALKRKARRSLTVPASSS